MKSKLIFIISLSISLLPIFIIFFPFIFNFGRTSANTKLLGKDYSFLNREQIKNRINQDFVLPGTINFKYQNSTYPLKLDSAQFKIDADSTASSLVFRHLNQGLSVYLRQLLHPVDANLIISFDEAALDAQIASISAQIDKPFIPTELNLVTSKSGSTVVTKTGQLGLVVDRTKVKTDLVNRLSHYQTSDTIDIAPVSDGQLPDPSQIAATEARASKLIGKSLSLTVEGKSNSLDDKTLISWLGFKNDYNTQKISSYISTIADSYKRDPVNAIFKFENNQVTEFQAAKQGIAVDQASLVSALPSEIDKLINSPEKVLSYTVPVKTTDPQLKTGDVNNLGIKELLGKGVSTFKHSSDIRNKNVARGSQAVNRILVAPGETFSFVKSLGEVSLESGYEMAYVIRAGKTELDVGGGICQVSTTLFRAMLNAGLSITERRHHAYRVSYYEEDMPPGYDATIFIPSPDLKFVNDTGHYVLVQNTFDLPNRTLTYEIYGTSDGRKTEISNYRQWDAAPAPPDVYIDDPTLPVGKIIKVESKVPGLKTSFDWKVTRDGQVIHQKTFTSVYTPWAAVYRRGPTPAP